jgi:hypothetical protein
VYRTQKLEKNFNALICINFIHLILTCVVVGFFCVGYKILIFECDVVVVVVVVVVVLGHIGKSLLSTIRAIVTDHSMLLKLYLNNIK